MNEVSDIDVTGDGMFLVGTHIPSGKYKLEAIGDSGYYCIYPNSRKEDIISNNYFDGQGYVIVSDGQYLVLRHCKFSTPPDKPVKSYSDADTIKKTQEALNESGYDCGTPEGISGSGTFSAIEKYQADNNLSVTGTITDELLDSLGLQ